MPGHSYRHIYVQGYVYACGSDACGSDACGSDCYANGGAKCDTCTYGNTPPNPDCDENAHPGTFGSRPGPSPERVRRSGVGV